MAALLFALAFNVFPGMSFILRVRHLLPQLIPRHVRFICCLIGGANAIAVPLVLLGYGYLVDVLLRIADKLS